jgi:hypothetical protein
VPDIAGLDVLAQQENAHLRVRAPAVCGDPDSLVGVGRRHPDIGEHDLREVLRDGVERLVEVGAGGDDLEVSGGVEHAADSLADQEAVVGEDDPDPRHGGPA